MYPNEKMSFSGHPLADKITTFHHGTNRVPLATKHYSIIGMYFWKKRTVCFWLFVCRVGYECVCAICTHIQIHIPIHMHGGQRRMLTIFLHFSLSILFSWLRVCHRTWISWEPASLRDAPASVFHRAGIKANQSHPGLFHLGSKIQTQVFKLTQENRFLWPLSQFYESSIGKTSKNFLWTQKHCIKKWLL